MHGRGRQIITRGQHIFRNDRRGRTIRVKHAPFRPRCGVMGGREACAKGSTACDICRLPDDRIGIAIALFGVLVAPVGAIAPRRLAKLSGARACARPQYWPDAMVHLRPVDTPYWKASVISPEKQGFGGYEFKLQQGRRGL